jgi:hypothetical protein
MEAVKTLLKDYSRNSSFKIFRSSSLNLADCASGLVLLLTAHKASNVQCL